MATVGTLDVNLTHVSNTMDHGMTLGALVSEGVQEQGTTIGTAIGIAIAVVLLFGVVFLVLGMIPKLIARVKNIKKA